VSRIAGEVIEQVAEVDVARSPSEIIVEKPIAARLRPIEHRRDERAGLRHEGDVAGARVGVRERRVQPRRASAADAVGAEDAQEVRARRGEHRLLGAAIEAGAHDDRGARAERPKASITPAPSPAACR
jgi:hypothetical protein